jgi:hypothetical protein
VGVVGVDFFRSFSGVWGMVVLSLGGEVES